VALCCSGGEEGAADAEAVLPTLDFISRVFENVHATINTWCRPSRMGAAVTVLRNMAIASWYQVGCPPCSAAACMLLLLPHIAGAAGVEIMLKCGSGSFLVPDQWQPSMYHLSSLLWKIGIGIVEQRRRY
jgi:hypothetical protein